MWRREPGRGRYAQLEREQRFLLREVPARVTDGRDITDRYIAGTRLRLRRVSGGGEAVFKLGQKVRPEPSDPSMAMLTNMYLSAEEYGRLAKLPAAELHKTRFVLPLPAGELAVDEFHGPLARLVLAEWDLPEGAQRRPLPEPAVLDVTDDDRFSGGSLAATSGEELDRLLESLLGG